MVSPISSTFSMGGWNHLTLSFSLLVCMYILCNIEEKIFIYYLKKKINSVLSALIGRGRRMINYARKGLMLLLHGFLAQNTTEGAIIIACAPEALRRTGSS